MGHHPGKKIELVRPQPQVPEQAHDPREGHPLLSHLGKQAVDSFRSFEEALVTEDQEVIVYRSGLTKGTGVLSGARRIDVTMSITRIPL